MTTGRTAEDVRTALMARDPETRMTANLARQLIDVETTLDLDDIRRAIAIAGFIAVPQRRRGDTVERADMLQVAESTVVYAVAALYAGVMIGIVLSVFRISFGYSCAGPASSCGASIALIAVGCALVLAVATGGWVLAQGTRRIYRRIEGERYLRATRRGAAGRSIEDGTSGYVWVGRKAA